MFLHVYNRVSWGQEYLRHDSAFSLSLWRIRCCNNSDYLAEELSWVSPSKSSTCFVCHCLSSGDRASLPTVSSGCLTSPGDPGSHWKASSLAPAATAGVCRHIPYSGGFSLSVFFLGISFVYSLTDSHMHAVSLGQTQLCCSPLTDTRRGSLHLTAFPLLLHPSRLLRVSLWDYVLILLLLNILVDFNKLFFCDYTM